MEWMTQVRCRIDSDRVATGIRRRLGDKEEVGLADRRGANKRGEVHQPAVSAAVGVVEESAAARVVDDLRIRMRGVANVEMILVEVTERSEIGEIGLRQNDL